MATALQLRRGTTAQHSSFTGAVGEVTVDTDKDTVVVHDGSTAGGFALMRESGGTFSGGITVTGALSVTGNTTLGDASGDSVTFNASTASLPNGLNFDSNTFVIDAANNRVGIGTATPSVALAVSSTDAVLVSNGTTAQRPGTPSAGMIRYNSSLGQFEGYTTTWGALGGGATGGGGDQVFQENSQTVTTSYTISSGKSASSAGPITINSGATVTVPSGSRWVIL